MKNISQIFDGLLENLGPQTVSAKLTFPGVGSDRYTWQVSVPAFTLEMKSTASFPTAKDAMENCKMVWSQLGMTATLNC